MKSAKPSWSLAGRSFVCVVAAFVAWQARSSRAFGFGGLAGSGGEAMAASAVAVLFIDHPDERVTALVQLKYAGSAEKFAWVVPTPAAASVRVSSQQLFQRLDAATSPQYWLEIAGEGACTKADAMRVVASAAPPPTGPTSLADLEPPDVLVIDQGTVDPYDYVTIAVDPAAADPAQAASDWLASEGYDVSADESRRWLPYLRQGFSLLAFKLTQGKDVDAIRPVALTYESALPSLPIAPAAAGAQANLGIQVWVIGPAQAVPKNYPSLVLNDALIDWRSGAKFLTGTLPAGGVGPSGPHVDKPSNYDALVSAAAAEAGGQGFVTELAQPANLYRDQVWSALDDEDFALLSHGEYDDGIAALLAASARYGGWDGFRDAVAGATELPDDVSLADFAAAPVQYRDVAHVDTDKFFALLEDKVIEPVSELAALLYEGPYLTRLYTVLGSESTPLDPSFDYNPELAQVSNIHLAKQVLECGAESGDPESGAWRVELPQGGVVVSSGGEDWPMAAGSLPANLKIVELGAHGPGEVRTDNSREIGAKLLALSGAKNDVLMPRPAIGATIGGSQRVAYADPSAPDASAKAAHSGGCSVSHAGASTGGGVIWCMALVFAACARRLRRRRVARAALALLLMAACSRDADTNPAAMADPEPAPTPTAMTPSQLQDPETCKGCHPTHYREWSSSMHAYSARDPVFLAMNRRGQRETHGQLGDFCIQCHAPMAARDGRSRDGLNLEELPDLARGVSCYFCHNAVHVDDDHNGKLTLAHDDTLRGPIHDPVAPSVHRAEFSDLFDDSNANSSALCGSCHDIVMPNGVHLERTFQEFRSGIFSKSATGEPPAFASCLGCHMPGRDGHAASVPDDLPMRTVHEHLWPGIDLPLIDFPHRDALRSAVEDCQLGGLSVSYFKLEVTPPNLFSFQFETNAGHNQPSGAAQDRRMWLEFLAYDEAGQLLEDSSGNIADGELEEQPASDPRHDPNLLLFGDHLYDAQGKQVHMFWEAAPSQAHPNGYESNLLPVATTTYVEGRHSVLKQYRASGPSGLPARVTARLRVRPIGLDVLRDLVASGDLDPALVPEMQTLNFGAQLEWTQASGLMKSVYVNQASSDCSTYRCLLDPDSSYCRSN